MNKIKTFFRYLWDDKVAFAFIAAVLLLLFWMAETTIKVDKLARDFEQRKAEEMIIYEQ